MQFVFVTYNRPAKLKRAYDSLSSTYGPMSPDNLLIINNHSEFTSPGDCRVLHNGTRPDWSFGHLARDWNHGILHGFGNAASPQQDWVCLAQDDVEFMPGWRPEFERMSRDRRFVSCGPGDQVMFIHIDAFRQVGWFDERFVAIGYHEIDYFFRCVLRLGEAAAIEGHYDELAWNWPKDVRIIRHWGDMEGHTLVANPMLFAWLRHKWGRVQLGDHHDLKGDFYPRLIDAYRGDPLPLEFNWYPYLYAKDDRDYSAVYYC